MDPTPQECWKADVFTSTPTMPCCSSKKRDGVGYKFNFANRWSWACWRSSSFCHRVALSIRLRRRDIVPK